MRINKFIGASFLALSLMLSQAVNADQIENESKEAATAPAGILVKVNPETKTVEVFRANAIDSKILNQTASTSETASAVDAIENSANKIAEFKLATSELEKESSTEAWYYNWYGYGYSWNNWGGYRPYYYNWNRPYYSAGYFSYGYSRYNYGYSYGYRNCYYGWYY